MSAKQSVFTLLACCAAWQFSSQPAVVAQPNMEKVYASVNTLENQKLGKTYAQDTISDRLERLEQKVFGKTQAGSLHQRLDALLMQGDATPAQDSSSSGTTAAPDTKPEQAKPDKPSAGKQSQLLTGRQPRNFCALDKSLDGADLNTFFESLAGNMKDAAKASSADELSGLSAVAHVAVTFKLKPGIFIDKESVAVRNSSGSKSMDEACTKAVKNTAAVSGYASTVKEPINLVAVFESPSDPPIVGFLPEIDAAPYMKDLQRRIRRSWFPPKEDESRRVVVVFKLDKTGTMSSLKIDKSSGYESADKFALKAVRDAAPFRPLPWQSPPDFIDVQFTFDRTVHKPDSDGHDS